MFYRNLQDEWYQRIADGADPELLARRTGRYCRSDVIHGARKWAEEHGLPVVDALKRVRPFKPRKKPDPTP